MPGRLRTTLAVMLLGWVMSTAGVRAQDSSQEQQPAGSSAQSPATPQTSGTAPSSGSAAPPGLQNPIAGQPQTETEQGAAPTDTRPLAGAQAITPTLPSAGRSFLIPSFSIWEGGDTNSQLVPGYSGVSVAAIPVASLDLHDMGRHNSFDLTYGGGGFLFESNWSRSAAFDDFLISDQYTARRWNFFISDRGTYLPESALGFQGIGFAGVFNNTQALGLGSGSGQLNSVYTPEQSILTGYAGTLSETAIAQVQYFLTPRTSLSAVGAFGYQEYTQEGLTTSNDRFGVLSIDHQFTPTETLSFSYSIMQIRFSGGSVALSDNVWRVGYGHRVTNHFTLTLLAGPELTYSAVRGVFGVMERLNWFGQGSLGYQGERGGVTLRYLHYLTPGSGVFQGAETSIASFAVNRELSRTWTGYASVSWSTNTAFSSYSATTPYAAGGRFNYEYFNLRLSHHFGRSTRVFAVYELQHQSSGVPITVGGSRLLSGQVFGAGIEWHPRPFGL